MKTFFVYRIPLNHKRISICKLYEISLIIKFHLFVQTNLRYTSSDSIHRFDFLLNRNWNARRNEIIVYSHFSFETRKFFIYFTRAKKKNFPNETNKIRSSIRIVYVTGGGGEYDPVKKNQGERTHRDLSWNLVKLDFVLHYETIAPNGDKRKKET